MGSLPNLDKICQEKVERREREKERELARERAREREFCHDRDSWRERAQSMQTKTHQRPGVLPMRRVVRTRSSGNTHHITDEPLLEHFIFSPTSSSKNHRVSPKQPSSLPASISQQHHIIQPSVLSSASASALQHQHVATTYSNPHPTNGHHHHHHIHHPHLNQQLSNPISINANIAGVATVPTRRRESANSSIGATSVRRLLTAVNRGCRHKIPVHVRAKVVKNFILLAVAHGLISATLVPLIGLQASNSVWYDAEHTWMDGSTNWLVIGTYYDTGANLLSLMFLLTSAMCFFTAFLIKRLGYFALLLGGSVGISVFLCTHFLPLFYILLPGYLILGLVFGPLNICKLNLVVLMAHKLSCGQHECCTATTPTNTTGLESDDNVLFPKTPCSRDENIRRLARWYHAAQDFGIIFGAIVASILLTCSTFQGNHIASQHSMCLNVSEVEQWSSMEVENSVPQSNQMDTIGPLITNNNGTLYRTQVVESWPTDGNGTGKGAIDDGQKNNANNLIGFVDSSSNNNSSIMNRTISLAFRAKGTDTEEVEGLIIGEAELLDETFDTNQHGQRICGADSCPVWFHNPTSSHLFYSSQLRNYSLDKYTAAAHLYKRHPTSNVRLKAIIAVFLVLSFIAIGLIVWSRAFTNKKNLNQAPGRFNNIRGLSETILFATPMAYFIGTEQGYILADFMKAFVSCSLGPHTVAGALIGLGIMQLIASCTLSMLLRHTKRLVVIIAGFIFHACLLLVLSRWKPSKDDSALFYVIAAAWGVCNGLWETLVFAMVTLTHKHHIVEVMSPLQGIKFLGLGITFAAHGFLCEFPKIVVLAILLVVSVPPYTSLEMRLEAQRKATQTTPSSLQIPTL